MNTRKIAVLNFSYLIGGQETFLLNLVLKLRNFYCIYLYINIYTWKFYLEELQHPNVNIIHINNFSYINFIHIRKKFSRDFRLIICNGNRAIYFSCLFLINFKKLGIQHSLISEHGSYLKRNIRLFLYKIITQRLSYLVGVSSKIFFGMTPSPKNITICNSCESRTKKNNTI